MFTFREPEDLPVMACTDYEERLLDYVDGTLPPAERHAVETHLIACPDCQSFTAALTKLDAALSSTIQSPALSPGFKTKILSRVDLEAREVSPELIKQKREALETQFQTVSKELPKRVLRSHAVDLIDLLGYIGIAAVAWLALDFLLNLWPALSPSIPV